MGVTTKPAQTDAESTPLVGNLAWLLSRASHGLTTELTAAMAAVGISPRGHCILSTAMTGEYTQIELAHAVGLDKTTMVVALDELEAAGLAKRLPSSEDRRARIVAVTKAGERKVAQGEQVVEQIQADVLSSLPAREQKALIDGLSRLVSERLADEVDSPPPVRRPRAS
jgi:MarR family transcriptional regulator, transcriptional regulator for hemolysin